MKILNTIFSIALAILFCSCSKDEDYVPQIASTISNSLYISIFNEKNEPINNVLLLEAGDVSVYEKTLKQYVKIEATDYNGINMLCFNVDLPTKKSMSFNEERTEGIGKVDLLMKIYDVKLPVSVNFIYSSSKDSTMYGGNSIRIKSIEYAGKTVIPTEQLSNYFIKIKYDTKNMIIEPL